MSNDFTICLNAELKAERLTRQHIKQLRRASELCDKVIEVAKKFDGKVLNVRFEKAMEEATKQSVHYSSNYIMENYYENFRISWFCDDRSVPDMNGCSCSYINTNSFELCNGYNYTEETSPIINKRIVAANLIPELQKQKEYFLTEADTIENGITKVDEWKERASELVEQINKLHDEIPYEIKDYYGLDIPSARIY